MNLVKKISISKLIGNIKNMLIASSKSGGENGFDWIEPIDQNLMRIVGNATSVGSGVSAFGEFIFFKGRFRASNLLTGEEVESGKLFLPDIAQDLIHGALNAVGDKSGGVDFAFDIGIKIDAQSATGYVYTCTPLLDTRENCPVARLTKMINDQESAKQIAEKSDLAKLEVKAHSKKDK